jgi:hypothetical protein
VDAEFRMPECIAGGGGDSSGFGGDSAGVMAPMVGLWSYKRRFVFCGGLFARRGVWLRGDRRGFFEEFDIGLADPRHPPAARSSDKRCFLELDVGVAAIMCGLSSDWHKRGFFALPNGLPAKAWTLPFAVGLPYLNSSPSNAFDGGLLAGSVDSTVKGTTAAEFRFRHRGVKLPSRLRIVGMASAWCCQLVARHSQKG